MGVWDYIGNPYTLTFGEAKDPVKGYQILNDDSSLTFVPTNLRKHVIVDLTVEELATVQLKIEPQDLVWIKLTGSREDLAQVTRKALGEILSLTNFKLDLIPLGTDVVVATTEPVKVLTQAELMDATIDLTQNVSDEQKARLKELWRRHA